MALSIGTGSGSALLGLVVIEGLLHLKNANMRNYDVEMWRYGRELTVPDAVLGHVHRVNTKATLQSVEIRTNELGLRGGPVVPKTRDRRDVLFLGSSITLGWGVPESETVSSRVEALFRERGEDAVTLNAAVANYNSERYVELFLTRLQTLEPTDIVVHYFLRDAEVLESNERNRILRNSQLAFTLWNVLQRLTHKTAESSLEAHYRKVYDPQAPGFVKMQAALGRLATYASSRKIRLYLAMTPDVHNLSQYPFGFVHETMQRLSDRLGYRYTDLLPALEGLTPERVSVFARRSPPEISLGHQRMASAIATTLSLNSTLASASP